MSTYEDEKKKKKREEEEIEAPLPLFEDEPQGQPRKEEVTPPPVAPVPEVPAPEVPATPAPETPAPSPTEGIKDEDVRKVADTKIGTAEDIYGKRLEMAEAERQATEDYIKEAENLHEGRKAKYDADTRAQVEANQRYLEEMKAINEAQNITNQDILNRYIKEAEDARKEHEDAMKVERRAVIGTGLAEVAASLVNLIGVAKGAENQNIHFYSEDWMKRSEQNRKDRVRRLDSLNNRREELERQMSALRTSQGKEFAQIAHSNESYQRNRDSAWDDKDYEFNTQMSRLRRGAESAYNTAKGEADIELTSKKGEAVVSGLSSDTGSSKGNGSGNDTNKKSGYDEDGIRIVSKPEKGWIKIDIGGKLYWFTPASIKENLETHRNDFGLSDAELAGKSPSERLSLLKSKINENPTIQNALRKASFGRAIEGSTEEVKPAKKNAYSAYE